MNDKDRLIENQKQLIDAQQTIIDELTKQLLLGNKPASIPYPVPYPVYPTPSPYPDPGRFVYQISNKNTAVDEWQGTRYYDQNGRIISEPYVVTC